MVAPEMRRYRNVVYDSSRRVKGLEMAGEIIDSKWENTRIQPYLTPYIRPKMVES